VLAERIIEGSVQRVADPDYFDFVRGPLNKDFRGNNLVHNQHPVPVNAMMDGAM
jgi:hypothetical protein